MNEVGCSCGIQVLRLADCIAVIPPCLIQVERVGQPMARKKRSSFVLFPSRQEDSLSLYVNIVSSDVSLTKKKKLQIVPRKKIASILPYNRTFLI